MLINIWVSFLIFYSLKWFKRLCHKLITVKKITLKVIKLIKIYNIYRLCKILIMKCNWLNLI